MNIRRLFIKKNWTVTCTGDNDSTTITGHGNFFQMFYAIFRILGRRHKF